MHSFEVSLGYESVDRTTFSTSRFIENVLRSTLSYPSQSRIVFLHITLFYQCLSKTTKMSLWRSTGKR